MTAVRLALILVLLATPLAAKAQPAAGKVWRIGILGFSPTTANMLGPDPRNEFVKAFDLLKQETGIDVAVAKYGLTGNGVAVGFLDRGIDWTSNDFRNADGTTRIA